ncbi:MRC1-like domain-containing protein [Mycena pura]|uniref:MRC1-like domain-containing protein n=1 Tax=Mycena pura TaxID=153505 RepID=A0AAD6YTW0_9AGAR|nr:MRC1-like domain-containing protein [Mycena pura]
MTPDKNHSHAVDAGPSPFPPPSMSAPMKRAPPRTYGRPKPENAVPEQSDFSLQPSRSALASISTTSTALSSLVLKNRTPSSPSLHPDVANGEGNDGDATDASDNYRYKWRDAMKKMDEEDDVDGAVSAPDLNDASLCGLLPSSRRDDAVPTEENPPIFRHSPPPAGDSFGASLPTLTASSMPSQASDVIENHSSPTPSLTAASRRRVVRRVSTSDEDSDDDANNFEQRSPVAPHPINTPKSRDGPSSTPPTSDDDMSEQIRPNFRSKGKGKPRIQVPPLVFEDASATKHGKRVSETVAATKLKAPTKKDKLDTVRDRGRIAKAQRVAVQRAEISGRNLQTFFSGIESGKLARAASLDDPISAFSSSPRQQRTATLGHVNEAPVNPLQNLPPPVELPELEESDDEKLPDVGDLLKVVKQDKTQAEKQKELKAKKLKLAANSRPSVDDDDDDDLEIVGPADNKSKNTRGSASKQNPSEGRKRQIQLGGISLAQQRAKQSKTPPKPLGMASSARTHDQLTREMAQLVQQTNADITKKKEDEWVRRGGRVVAPSGGSVENGALRVEAVKLYAEKGRMNAEAREARMQVDGDEEDEDASDDDWSEPKGPASPQVSDTDAEDGDITMVNEDGDEDGAEHGNENEGEEEQETDENEAPVQARSRGPRRIRLVVESDEENDENAGPSAKSAALKISAFGHENELDSPVELASAAMHRGSVSSLDERTEDEGDKENNTRLMYDKSDDKENKAVPRHPFGHRPMLGRQGSLFGLEDGLRSRLSMSPGSLEPMSDGENGENGENEASANSRQPLQNLVPDADPFIAERSSSDDFAARLHQASRLPGQEVESLEATLRPSFEPGRLGTKITQDDSFAFKGAPLQPGFSELFDSGTEQQRGSKRPLTLSASLSEKSETGLFALRQKNTTLGLTQDVELQPAFEVGDHLRRQADAIFEKEQVYVWEAANSKPETKKQDVYINDLGFLTQTRPGDAEEDAEVYRPTSPSQSWNLSQKNWGRSTQNSGLSESQSLLRLPLRTLSLKDVVDSDSDSPKRSPRRLTRGTRTWISPPRSTGASPSPLGLRPQNAFAVVRSEPLKDRSSRPKHPLKKSEFIEVEAQESDDDEMVGFGHKQDDADEEDGEDQDQTLQTLVDDQEMDETTAAADRVIEKFQEHQHEDDLANEKLQQAVVHGELRKNKRRNRTGVDEDSDEEDDEDEMRARKMRRGLNEPRIERGDVNELAKNPQTVPFFQVYKNDLHRGDDPEFSYLQETQAEEAADAEMDNREEDEREEITTAEISRRVRELAKQPEMAETKVKAVSRKRVTEVSCHVMASYSQLTESRKNLQGTDRDDERMKQWYKVEARSRNAGTGRASGRTAVTGQQVKAKPGGSLRPGAQSTGKSSGARHLLKESSVLAGLASDRSSRFL